MLTSTPSCEDAAEYLSMLQTGFVHFALVDRAYVINLQERNTRLLRTRERTEIRVQLAMVWYFGAVDTHIRANIDRAIVQARIAGLVCCICIYFLWLGNVACGSELAD